MTDLTNHMLDDFDKVVPGGLDIIGEAVVKANFTRVKINLLNP